MAKFFPVSPAIWNKRVIDLGLETVVLYNYVLSSPHRNSEGLYRLPIAYACADLGLGRAQVEASLKALEAEQLIAYDFKAEVILDLHALHLLPPKSDTQTKGAIVKLRQVPRTPLLERFYLLAIVFVPKLAEEMDKAFPELKDSPPRDSPDTIDTPPPDSQVEQSQVGQSRDSHNRGRQLGEGVESPRSVTREDEVIEHVKRTFDAEEVSSGGGRW